MITNPRLPLSGDFCRPTSSLPGAAHAQRTVRLGTSVPWRSHRRLQQATLDVGWSQLAFVRRLDLPLAEPLSNSAEMSARRARARQQLDDGHLAAEAAVGLANPRSHRSAPSTISRFGTVTFRAIPSPVIRRGRASSRGGARRPSPCDNTCFASTDLLLAVSAGDGPLPGAARRPCPCRSTFLAKRNSIPCSTCWRRLP